MPERFWVRAVLGLLTAGVVFTGLFLWLPDVDTEAAPREPLEAPIVATVLRSPRVLDAIAGPGAWLIYLAADVAELPPSVEPIVRVSEGGRLRLERKAPVSEEPEPQPWLAAGIVLPARSLAELSPVERVTLLDACAALAGPRAVTPEQVVPLGLDCRRAEIAVLLHWLR